MASTFDDRVDGISTSTAIKAPVKVATTANITLSGTQTIDGVSVVAGDRVLVKNQTDATENGIYVAASTSWSRSEDFDGNRDIRKGTLVYINQGSNYAGFEARVTTSDPITIGTSSISFTTSTSSLVYDVKSYGALADGSDATAAIQSAIDAASAAGGGIVYIPEGNYSVSSFDLTNAQSIHIIGGASHWGVRLYANRQSTSGKPVFDCTGMIRCSISCISVLGQSYLSASDPTIIPTEGFLVAESSSQSCAENHFTEIRTYGKFSKSALLSFGCTNSTWKDSIISNDHADGYAAYVGKTNATLSPTSTYDTVKTNPTAATENDFFGCEFHARDTDNTGTVATVFLDSARTTRFFGGLIENGTAVGAYVRINGAVEDITMTGVKFYSETGTGTGDVFYLAASATLTRLSVLSCVNDNTLQAGAQFIKDGGSASCTSTVVLNWKTGEVISDIAGAFALIVDTNGIQTEVTFAINDDLFVIRDTTDNTKNFKIDAANITTGTTRTWIVPDTDDTFVGQGDAATQAEQEAGTATDAFVTPGRQHFHQSAAKFWINYEIIGTVGVTSSYNITGISDTATGITAITIANDMADGTYVVVGQSRYTDAANTFPSCEDFAAGSFNCHNINDAGAATDADVICLAGFGDMP